ncbi:MAG: 23S rRNA (adenine(2503)-C(2))-methyltransferase RlmN [Verrucomicrobiota bacterium]
MPGIHDQRAMAELGRRLRVDPYRLRRLRTVFYKKQAGPERALEELPPDVRDRFAAEVGFHSLGLAGARDSKVDGATKLLFRTRGGHLIESVILRIASGRTALCVSSQAGCAADCAFCATGRMGLAANLAAEEILDQVVQANQRLAAEQRRVRNVVFMGMGEPFHNEENLTRALEVLRAADGFCFEERRLLVSTVGIPDAMVRCAERFRRIGMALSLHSARQEVRERIVPMARRHDLKALREALREVTRLRDDGVMIEYTLLRGINDGPEDLEALARYVEGLRVHINLIPYNPIASAPELEGTPPAEREAFAKELKGRGLKVTIRYSLGADISAACGTLATERRRGF